MIRIILKQHTRGSWKIAYLWDEGLGEPIFMGAQFLSPCQGMIGCTGHRREVSQVAIMHNATMVPGFHFGVETRVGIDQWRNSTVYITYNIYIYIYMLHIWLYLYVFIMVYIYLLCFIFIWMIDSMFVQFSSRQNLPSIEFQFAT